MNKNIEINGNMDLGAYSPLELTEEEVNESLKEKAVSKAQHIVTVNKPTLRKIIKETIINYLNFK